ncbi:unnamed protein product [Brassica rapa]|uniref:Yippee domain-containing protein n=1 Tax=Brassica campestris TaxID=3711 RepID=A0A3P6B6B7_BRACM|nr:unnamed protein product [Brassica rapa]VDC92021.1 unnamed protein product [Brassica rapa]
MGRAFGIELEGAVYTCKWCETHLGVQSDIISKETEDGCLVYVFSRLYNTIILAEATGDFHDIFCVGCSNDIGIYGVSDPNSFRVLRSELHGPEGSDDEGKNGSFGESCWGLLQWHPVSERRDVVFTWCYCCYSYQLLSSQQRSA